MVSCRCFSIQCSSRLIHLLFLYPCYVRSNTLFIKYLKFCSTIHSGCQGLLLSLFFKSGENAKIFYYINFKSVAWCFQYLLNILKFRSESNSKTWLMLIYGVLGIFAHKKTIKQFLQPMIEQVWGGGGGGMCQEDVLLFFCVSFSELMYFCVGFFQFTDAFFGSILQISAYFLLHIMCISSKSQTVFWAQNFRDIQLIPNFLRYPAWL